MIILWILLGIIAFFLAFSLGWRWASRIWSLPCPSLTAWRFDNPLLRRLTRSTLDRLEIRPGQRILEIGPGPGRLLIPAAQRALPGGEAVGIGRDFDRTVKINLKEERGKGERVLKIASLFKPEGELRRRAMFGAQLAPITKEVRDRQKLDGDGGVVLEKIFPGTSAADGDFKAGDVILAVGGIKVSGMPNFLRKMEEARAGDVLTLDVVRDRVRSEKRVTLKEMPREKGDGYDVIYGSVTSHGARLRTIVTRPKAEGRHPAVLLLQGGHTCFSIDNPVGTPFGFTWVARNLARHGYITMRVERPGCGDSEGGPLRHVDFDTELDGYKQALRALKQLDFVDADNVFLFGHSQGGINAPLMAVEIPVRGIAVFGTVSCGGIEGMLGQRRRLAMLDGTNPAEVDREVLAQARFWYPLLVEKKTPREIRAQYPELPKRVWEQWVTGDSFVADRHYTFYHQGADKNLAEAWTKVAATRLPDGGKIPAEPLQPRVLAIWGKSDWLVDKAGNAWIAEIVNRVKPGNGSFVVLDSIDHFFLRTATPEESYRYFKPVKGMPPTEFNRAFVETLTAWLDETAGRAKKVPEKPPKESKLVGGGDRFAGMDAYISVAMKKWEVPGLAIAVVKDGKVVLARGYGNRQMGRDAPVTTDTVFPIASCTKSFTASCIAMLVDDGKLNWDDPVRKHLPDFKVADAYVTEHVTIRDLLCHRTGLVRGDLLGMGGAFTHAEMLNQLQFLPQAVPFRTKVTYNSLMYTVLGEIVARKSGMSWQKFVRTRLFEPLEMKATTTDRESIAADRLATRHRLYDGELAPLRTPPSDRMAPGGAIHSTASDMAAWLNFHLRAGEHNGHPLVKQSTMREMHSLQQSIPVKWRPDSDVYDARFVGTGLGWYVRDYRGRKVIQHGGAWGAEMALVPEEDHGVVVLSNRDWNGLVWMLIYDVIDAYVVGPDPAWSKGKKWERWLQIGGPNTMGRDLKEQRAQLEKHRKTGTRPSRPITEYAGTYRSTLYGNLKVTVVDGRLHMKFGDYAATFEHWEQDSFYGRAVIEPFFDWLVKFDIGQQGSIQGLEIIHVGWKDPDERFLFTRRVE